MDGPPNTHESTDGTGAEPERKSLRPKRRWVVPLIILGKLAMIAVILALPSGLALSLGAAHGVVLLVLLVSAAVVLILHRRRGTMPRLALPHRIGKNRGRR